MAKFEIKIKADLTHLMEYVQNSLNTDFLPVDQLEPIVREYNDVKIIFRRYGTHAGMVMVIYTVKSGEDEICVEILNPGMFGQRWVYEGGGDNYMQYIAMFLPHIIQTVQKKPTNISHRKKNKKVYWKQLKIFSNKKRLMPLFILPYCTLLYLFHHCLHIPLQCPMGTADRRESYR